ncbi:MAG: Xaa-Pro peptidase family protein [Candidatus Aerophobetes bacterium]|nr:Xaa-Pro peptidase family protein [Candidatus Aerophobetes bacterium]
MNEYLADEKNSRLGRFTREIKLANVNLTFITSSVSIYYLTGILITPYERLVVLIVSENGRIIIFVPKLEEERIKENSKKISQRLEVVSWDDKEDAVLKLSNVVKNLGLRSISNIAIEKKDINLATFEKFTNVFANIRWKEADGILENLRLLKDEQEIKCVSSAVAYTDKAFEYFFKCLGSGKTELEMVDVVSTYFKKLGSKIEGPSFEIQVVSGKKSANPHGIPGSRKIEKGDFVILDMGVKVGGYCSDMTRTFIVGNYSEKQREIYETVLEAQREAINIVKPGIAMQKVDEAARAYIESKGYGEYFTHRTGHGIGLEIHERPFVGSQNKNLLKEGMIFTIEPGIYISGIGGVRIEDDILVTDKGVKVIGSYPKGFESCLKLVDEYMSE